MSHVDVLACLDEIAWIVLLVVGGALGHDREHEPALNAGPVGKVEARHKRMNIGAFAQFGQMDEFAAIEI